MTHPVATPTRNEADNPAIEAPDLRAMMFGLFFVFGGITSLNDVLIPKLRALFTLSHADAMLVQSAFFAAYLLVSLPATLIVRRLGYLGTAVAGLLTMTVGCLLFVPASTHGSFAAFLVALFVLAAGITIVQVVANPLISMLGAPWSAHSRLTFAQAFNSLGTTVFPYVGSALILGAALEGAPRSQQTHVIALTYVGLAAALLVAALVFWLRRHRLAAVAVADEPILAAFTLLRQPRFALGTACIFLYVGAEVAIGSIIVSFLMQPDVLAATPLAAGQHVPYYWGGAMVGRFVGAGLLRLYAPGKVLAAAALGAGVLVLTAAAGHGEAAALALLAVGLCNSIMFPTIFSLACEGLGARTHEGSGLLCVAIVGGAVVPWLLGHVADVSGLRGALVIPALCYLCIVGFGVYARRPLPATAR